MKERPGMHPLRQASILALLVTAACAGGRVIDPEPSADGGQCGVLGGACCANDSCGSGLACQSGTCQQSRQNETGKACTRNADCESGICLPVPGRNRNVCTVSCANTSGCTPGWQCAPLAGASNVCQCTPSTEACDGEDNDCDGIVDNQPNVDTLCEQQFGTGNRCLAGQCQLPGCMTSGDCLAGQICDPLTLHCVVRTETDGGPVLTDGGFDGGGRDGGPPDGGPRDGGFDAGPQDAGATSCTTRYDCSFGEKCSGGFCVAVSIGAGCAADPQCGRGQACNFAHQCEVGCLEAGDCHNGQLCSTTFQCVTCGRSHPCPSGQVCVDSGGSATCQAAATCTSSSTCNSNQAGSVCVSGSCTNCTSDTPCQNSPYGSGYTCNVAGFCSNAVSCDIAACSNTCYAQGRVCDRNTCGCTGTTNCNDARCPSGPCGAGTSCDANTCTCTQNTTCGGSLYCQPFIGGATLCEWGGGTGTPGTCDGLCNCDTLSTCTSSLDCGANQVCQDSGCQDIAVDSQGLACSLTKCRSSSHPCKNANTGVGCICGTANNDGLSGSTMPVACD